MKLTLQEQYLISNLLLSIKSLPKKSAIELSDVQDVAKCMNQKDSRFTKNEIELKQVLQSFILKHKRN